MIIVHHDDDFHHDDTVMMNHRFWTKFAHDAENAVMGRLPSGGHGVRRSKPNTIPTARSCNSIAPTRQRRASGLKAIGAFIFISAMMLPGAYPIDGPLSAEGRELRRMLLSRGNLKDAREEGEPTPRLAQQVSTLMH